MLTLVPTPIGNLGDITYRAVEVMKSADLLLCEDTRTSSVLLKHYGISRPLQSHHQHNEHGVLPGLIAKLKDGLRIALLTDAGTPGISDPGYLLLRECIREGIAVECLPGATAFVPAVVQSGFPPNAFSFIGFLPQKKGRLTALKALAAEGDRTIILYESPHRLARTLRELGEHLGSGRPAAVCRELTKKFEETRRGSLADLQAHYEKHPPKGEIVIVVGGTNMPAIPAENEEEQDD